MNMNKFVNVFAWSLIVLGVFLLLWKVFGNSLGM